MSYPIALTVNRVTLTANRVASDVIPNYFDGKTGYVDRSREWVYGAMNPFNGKRERE
ncbi:hypothetical protein [Sinomicrobium sp. M5D2P9]